MTLPPSTYIGCLLQTPTCLPTRMPLLRVPYTDPLPLPKIIPQSASTASGAIAALTEFLSAPSSPRLKNHEAQNDKTLLLTGAGISVASGLADYRGTNGTYMLNKAYRPIYYHEFTTSHEARKRYWARSFLGWTNLHNAKPNKAHWAVKRFGELGRLSSVITQSISSLPATALSRLTIATRRRLIPSESASAASNARAARVSALPRLPYLPQRILQRGVSEAACGPQSGLGCLS
jgi:Sir2 family